MKKDYATIKKFYHVYEVEITVLTVTAVYMSMLLARSFWIFKFENADLKNIAACRMWDRKVSIQAVILFFITAVILGLVLCCVFFFTKQKHVQGDKILADRKKTGNFFRTYIKELRSAYMLSVAEAMLFFHFVRYQFLETETEIMDLITYKQLVFDCHVKIFFVCNIALLLLFFPNFAHMINVRRNENIIKIILEMKNGKEKTKK